MFDPSQQVRCRIGKIIVQEDQRIDVAVWFFLKDTDGYNHEADVTVRLKGDYKLSDLTSEAIQKGRELLSELASRPLDLSPRQ